jgi:hypothetical protein
MLCLASATNVLAAFVQDRIFVYRIGTGAAPLTANSEPVFIDQYTSAGMLVSSTPMPVAAAAANKPFTATTAALEGDLSLSANGELLVAGGYGAAPGASVAGSASNVVNRVIARIDSSLAVDTSTAFNAGFSGASPWGVVTADGTSFWANGGSGSTGGIWHVAYGVTGGTQLSETNYRDLAIFNGQLLGLTVSSGAALIGTGLPTMAGPAITPVTGFGAGYGGRRWAFVDQRLVNSHIALYIVTTTGLDKWTSTSYSAGWQLQGSIAAGASAFGVTGASVTGTGVILYYSTGSTVMKVVDDGVTPFGMLAPTLLASAPSNTVFRGVALTASSSPPPMLPGAPSIKWAMPTSTTITLAFAPPASDGGSAIEGYTVSCNPGGFMQGGTPDAPNTISGLTPGAPPPGCSLDIVGNGEIDALTDGLILIRAMFGLTGTAATSNAIGQGAGRSNWNEIRAFLNANCATNFPP